MNIEKQLLCSFSRKSYYEDTIQKIKSNYNIIDKKIFVFVNDKSENDLYLTFNIQRSNINVRCKGVISIHRKKQTNTLYTLNAMNRLIEDENNGVYDKNFQLNWEYYKNSIILTNEVGVKIIPLKLISIVAA